MQRRHYMMIGDIFKIMKDEILNPDLSGESIFLGSIHRIYGANGLRFLNMEYVEFKALVHAFALQLEQRNENFNFSRFIDYIFGDD